MTTVAHSESSVWRSLAREALDPVKFSKVFLQATPTAPQVEILRDPRPFRTIVAGRRFGKSFLEALDLLWYACTAPGSIQYILAPSYDQVDIIFQEAVRLLSQSPLQAIVKEVKNAPFPKIEFLHGSVIHGRSSSKPQFIRGKKAHRIKLDEAGFVPDETVNGVIEPMLADYDGGWDKVGTPYAKNHFYETFTMGRSPTWKDEYASYHFTSYDNPHISRRYIQRMERRYGRDSWVFRTEYLAEFLDALTAVFGWEEILSNVDATINPLLIRDMGDDPDPVQGVPHHQYAIGVDLARTMDYTVIAGLDVTTQPWQLVYFDRFQRRPWAYVFDRIRAVQEALNGAIPLIDQTGVGDVVVEMVADTGAEGIKFNIENKTEMIIDYQKAIQAGEVVYPHIHSLVQEMKYYEMTPTKSGRVHLEAQKGYHDDTITAVGLAIRSAKYNTLPADWSWTGPPAMA